MIQAPHKEAASSLRLSERNAIIGTFPPVRCGIATFTQDLVIAINRARPLAPAIICAIRPPSFAGRFAHDASLEVEQHRASAYIDAADRLNDAGASLISLQHEFGIFGGPAGDFILRLLDRCRADVIATLHTVKPDFSRDERRVLDALVSRCRRLVVMAEKGKEILVEGYGIDPAAIEVIPHGVPTRPLPDAEAFKRKLGLDGRKVLMTFGLIGRGKGLETMIHAMPRIAKARPDSLYVVLGATHPNVVASEGERYREELGALARSLGVEKNILFIDRYATRSELLDYLSAADIYVTPYLNEKQITSGTLAYAYALGKPIISTPYWHAAELLADGRGALCDFGDSAAFAEAARALLADPARLEQIGRAAYEAGADMRWPAVGRQYADLFDAVRNESAKLSSAATVLSIARKPPTPSIGHLAMMTDDVGLLQHAKMNVAKREEGYCIDDNARGLLAIAKIARAGLDFPDASRLETAYAAFVQSAFNESNGRFRNFLGYDRRWLDAAGSEDSHGRTLHALAAARTSLGGADRRRWADWLFFEGLGAADAFSSPRAVAHVVNALCLVTDDEPAPVAERLRTHAGALHARLRDAATADWFWFEPYLAYENALLPGALLGAAVRLADAGMRDDALAALGWLTHMQTAEDGWFRPVGTGSFGAPFAMPSHFDQQPLEAYATIAAYAAAFEAEPSGRWRERAQTVYRWFEGYNDLDQPLIDAASFACCDGLQADGVNCNKGAESCLAAILSALELNEMARVAESRARGARRIASG